MKHKVAKQQNASFANLWIGCDKKKGSSNTYRRNRTNVRCFYDVVNSIFIRIVIDFCLIVPMSIAMVHPNNLLRTDSLHKNLGFEVTSRNDSVNTNIMELKQQQQQLQRKVVGSRTIRKQRKVQQMTTSEFSSFPLSSSSSLLTSKSEMQKTSILQQTGKSTASNEQKFQKHNDLLTSKQEVQSLIEYIDSLGDIAKHFILFQWNASGILDHVSCSRSNWLPTDDIYTIFGRTRPSTYGTIAMLFNLDAIKHIPWNVIPPVPVMVYTIPYNAINNHNNEDGTMKKQYYTSSNSNTNIGSSRYILVPNAYDRRGYSENAVEQVRQRLRRGDSNISSSKDNATTYKVAATTEIANGSPFISFEEYQLRANVIVWRGREVGEDGRKLLILLAESPNINMHGNNTSNNIHKKWDFDENTDLSNSSSQKQHGRKNHDDSRQQHRQEQQVWLDVAFTVSGQAERLRNEIDVNETYTNDTSTIASTATTFTSHGKEVSTSLFENSSKRIPREVMASKYKYQIDIGGVSGTSWDGLRWKMCASGSLVFKVDTFSKDWWHDTIYPWVHYIPVQADLTNLYELYKWAESHPLDAYTISINGQRTCLQTFTKEYSEIIQKGIIQALPPTTAYRIVQETNMIFQYNLTGITWE